MHQCHLDCHHGPSRRHMLAMLSAAGASAVGLRHALAQGGEWMIDTHHHIFSHGGGTMPMIVQRFGSVGRNFTPEEIKQALPDGFEAMVKRQYYDIASVAMNPGGMAAVLNLIPASQLFYGSDAPFGSTTVIADRLAKFALSPGEIRAIRRENALRLFPRYAA